MSNAIVRQLLQLPAHHEDILQDVIQGDLNDENLNELDISRVLPAEERGMKVANAERQRIESEHKQIPEEVLHDVLAKEPITFDVIYIQYTEKCSVRE